MSFGTRFCFISSKLVFSDRSVKRQVGPNRFFRMRLLMFNPALLSLVWERIIPSMSTIALETASADLVALAAQARAGEEVIFTDNEQPVAKLVPLTQLGPRATPQALEQRRKAFEDLRKLDPFHQIEDPVAWQRETRKDRDLPGRD